MPEPVQVDDAVEKVRRVFQSAFEERKIKFTTSGLTDLPEINADKGFLHKVLYHVIGNAIKYTPDGGQITISGHVLTGDQPGLPESGIEIIVSDTGIGIDPQLHEAIFEKFYQTGQVALHSTGKTKFKGGGPGLGLTIARGIVQAQGGRLWVESQGYDEGTCPGSQFHVVLLLNPVIQPQEQEPPT
jgi:signal transduction histidine kinase